MENELARIRVDALNTAAHNRALGDTLKKLVDSLAEKDKLVEKYELETRQRNDEVEKKMYLVDRLNRKLEALTKDVVDENTGPLEATIKNLTKLVGKKDAEIAELQRQWLVDQTLLVNRVATTDGVLSEVRDMKGRLTIFEQKKVRLDGVIRGVQLEIKRLNGNVDGMHNDMVRLNSLIAKNSELQEKLATSTFNMEREFVEKLKELEVESAGMDAKLATLKEEKLRLLDDIVEAERQVMLWEKKIVLERETQAALDPNVGQAESRAMQKEIHRMRLRYEALQRDQERMLAEMERAVEKREMIALRNRGKSESKKKSKNKKDDGYTKSSLKKKIKALRKGIKSTTKDAARHESRIKTGLERMEELALELQQSTSTFEKKERAVNELQKRINGVLYEKQRSADAISRANSMIAAYAELTPEAEAKLIDARVEGELESAKLARASIHSLIRGLQDEFPQLEEVLERVAQLSNLDSSSSVFDCELS